MAKSRDAVNASKRPRARVRVGRTPRRGQDSGLWRPRLGQGTPEARSSGAAGGLGLLQVHSLPAPGASGMLGFLG